MAAYYKAKLRDFVSMPTTDVLGALSRRLLERFPGNQQEQLKAWQTQIELIHEASHSLLGRFVRAAEWGILFEVPLMRLQRRLDVVLLVGQVVAVVEFKTGAPTYERGAARQVEDYALDLRDFHLASRVLTIVPILCATEAADESFLHHVMSGQVLPIHYTNRRTLPRLLQALALGQEELNSPQVDVAAWDESPYRPVPTIIQAAELLYAGHNVTEIAHAAADVENLGSTSRRLIEIAEYARERRRHVVCFVTGVPGSGKTLTGLNLVHNEQIEAVQGIRAAYLSGNTPLVEVLREALARDRSRRTGEPKSETRRIVRTEIQHLMDYLREYITEHPTHCPPEHVIVFDEAQRAWDAAYGKQKFDRAASEATLFLEIMRRHQDWALIVALVGGGQEINIGESGLRGWGDALLQKREWEIFAPPDLTCGSSRQTLFDAAIGYPGQVDVDEKLHLGVSIRSFRCEAVATWVDNVLAGQLVAARKLTDQLPDFPVYLTRNLAEARAALRSMARGFRRVGLVASSGARRLRADGLGVTLSATDRDAYVHWYLERDGDIRSATALEVTANEYTCQGLELDFVGLCWGGDMLWSKTEGAWEFQELSGPKWKTVHKEAIQEYIRNTYRVLMTRARLALVLWIPEGDAADLTRNPEPLTSTADALRSAGARCIEKDEKFLMDGSP